MDSTKKISIQRVKAFVDIAQDSLELSQESFADKQRDRGILALQEASIAINYALANAQAAGEKAPALLELFPQRVVRRFAQFGTLENLASKIKYTDSLSKIMRGHYGRQAMNDLILPAILKYQLLDHQDLGQMLRQTWPTEEFVSYPLLRSLVLGSTKRSELPIT